MKKAVIMAGGFGTRLRPLTMNIPKPMVPIVNIPMMEHIVNLLKKHGIKDIVSLLYFQPEKITSYFEDGSRFGIHMDYVQATADYGTAGSVKNAYEYLKERFIIISGDVLTDFDLTKAVEFHISKGAKATILLTRVDTPLQYGIVMTDEDGKITRFLEKPSWGQVFSDTINTGIYILEPEVLDMIPYREEFDFSQNLFPKMLELNMPLYGYIADGYWRDIGNLDEYIIGQYDALTNAIKVEKHGIVQGNLIKGDSCNIAPTAKFSGQVLVGNNVTIGEYSELIDCVVGDNCVIGNGVKFIRATLWNNCKLGDFVKMTDDVVCSNVEIGDSVVVGENVFISDNCKIENNATLKSNIKLWPNKRVEEGATVSFSLIQEEKWQREIFTDARITGQSNVEIHPDFGAKLGTALGLAFGAKARLLASRDPAETSRIMKRSITAGLASVGVNVSDLQTISIPQTRQELRTGRYDGGLHVRRSPRDPDQTDIIIFNKDGRDISINMAKKIERYFFGEDIKRVHYSQVGKISYPERTNEIYINRFLDSLDVDLIKNRKYKLLVDYSYGLASTILPSLLGKLKVEAISLNNYVDATTFHPDPFSQHSDTDETGKIMRSLGYELGFRIESGAEKISIIDERGTWYHPMRLLSIITKLFLDTNRHREPYKIAVSIVATQEIEQIAKEYNVEVIRIKNSHSAMMDATIDPDVLFVGGVWGGYIFRDFLFASDGMYSLGKILEMLAQTNCKISTLDEKLPRRFVHSRDVNVPWNAKGTVMRKAMEHSENLQRQLIEGVKIFLDGSCVLLLPSKERPIFTVYGESDDYETAVALCNKYANLVEDWREE